MPGFVIHTAIGQEYYRKHNNIENYNDFIIGNIDPDLTKNKAETHYGKSPAYTNLKEFLDYNTLDTSLNKGRFLHLVTDYLFYNYYLDKLSKEVIHNDYDLINKVLIEKYDIKLPEDIKKYVFFKEGKPKILTLDLAIKVINEISNLDIEKIRQEVMAENKRWSTYKKLI